MQLINMMMIYYCDKKPKKRLHVLESDIITIKKTLIWPPEFKEYILQD